MAEEVVVEPGEESPPVQLDSPTDPPKEPSEEPSEPTASAVLQKQVDDLTSENKTLQQRNKEDAQKILSSVLSPPPAEPRAEPTDDEYLTDPKKASEAALEAMYEKKIAPQHVNTSARLFSIDYKMVQAGADAIAFEKLKPDIDKYFSDNPDAIHVPNALQTVFTHFKGIHFNRLHKEMNEATETAEANPPPSPKLPSPKKTAALSEEEKRFARGVGLTDEQMLESKKELLG